ncbi:MAG: hypothetical protein HXM74_03475, partial [Mogibacterium diversum]|nr:hypothetical protein [Mogibacterium diversum]
YAIKSSRIYRRGGVQTGDNLPFMPFVIFGASISALAIVTVSRRKRYR